MGSKEIDTAALDRDLQNLPKAKRGWLRRTGKWALILLLFIVVGGGGFAYWLIYQRVFGHEAYQHAMTKIAANKDIKAALGEPITTRMTNPGPAIRQESTETNILWTITGPSGKEAKAHVYQQKRSGKWETIISEVTMPDGNKISLIDEEEGGAPPFQSPAAPSFDPNAKPTDKPADNAANDSMPEDLSPNIPQPEEAK
jgi:hypothetical protein